MRQITSSSVSFGSSWPLSCIAIAALLCCYIAYQRYFHPLARFPGPLVASLTNVWKSYHTYHLRLHEELVLLHQRYGAVVRIGPNDLHFWNPSAISIYKAGRSIGKTEFYDAFTTFNPNLFGTQDEDIHSLRRRQLAHGFSQASIKDLEYILDDQLTILCHKIHRYTETHETFDLKDCISQYVLDILGEVAFSRSFNAQTTSNGEDIHAAINDHILLACIIGQLPMQNIWKQIAANSPIPWMRRLLRSRAALKATCADCVSHRIKNPSSRKDLLRSLIEAKDPETGARLTELDINTEAFAMLVAGSHTTSGTLGLLFWHLLQNPEILTKAVSELDINLETLPPGKTIYQIDGLEDKMPFTMACIRENFRMNPVFTMCLWRRVHVPEGVDIDGYHIPQGTNVGIVNHALHHNHHVWGADHETFDPERWFDKRAEGKENFLLPFSIGHRMCIGRNLAMTNIVKTTTTLLKTFEFEKVGTSELQFLSSGIGELDGPLLCKARLRQGIR